MTMTLVFKKITAWLAVVAVVLSAVPLVKWMTAQAQPSEFAVLADPVTMHDWQAYFGERVMSTQNAGGVWTDKSVMTDASAFGDSGITLEDRNGFLVALSAIASNTVISGMTNIPTDVMLVLDVSGKDTASLLTDVASINRLMEAIRQMNRYNRIGLTVYSGGKANEPSTEAHSKLLLPLDRYTASADGMYVTVSSSSIAVANGVTDSAGQSVTAHYPLVASTETYTQLGLLTAMEHMLSCDPAIPDHATYLAGKTRLPLVVLVSDNVPTVATLDYTKPMSAQIRVSRDTDYGTAQVVFATQLTAAYVKSKLASHYRDTTPLLYTLSKGNNRGIADPKQSDVRAQTVMDDVENSDAQTLREAVENRAVDGYWQLLLNDGAVAITALSDADRVKVTHTAFCVEEADGTSRFPTDASSKYYVDEVFTHAENDAFSEVFEKLNIQSHYHPTLVTENADLSGYISFVDKIGDYMNVTDIKGILIDDTLCSGALLSKNFITGGGALGTFNDPKPLGDELVWAVQARIGVDADTARDLLGLAYAKGQLAYTDDEHFSNYIGWYANQNGEFLGFWYDGITSMPDPEDSSLDENERPAYIMKSYGYLGTVDERHGVTASDLMYATVQHRTDLLSGEEMISFAVPASLIPIVNYEVTLHDDGTPADMQVAGAASPIRLVYEVSLDSDIDAVSVTRLVEEDYPHRAQDGTYYFYTNQFEQDDHMGYGAVNTYSYFVPSTENARYYYTANEKLYIDQNGTPLTTQPDVNGVYYRAANVFVKDGTVKTATVYERVSAVSLGFAACNRDGVWYLPEGTVHTMLDGYTVPKDQNPTESLSYCNAPFVDARYTYYVGATLGNNGRVALRPETGICVSNTVKGETEEAFYFSVTRTDTAENKTYHAQLLKADGDTANTTVTFVGGNATFSLANGESMRIYGMTDGASYRVTQTAPSDFRLEAVGGDQTASQAVVTVETARFVQADFTNVKRGTGNLTVTNRVHHEFDSTYEMPDKRFSLSAHLGESYAGKTISAAHSADHSLTSLTADQNGTVTFSLRHTEQLELIGLMEGTVVTVTETAIPSGFTPIYYGVGEQGQNAVTILSGASVSMIVLNRYETAPIQADVDVRGTMTRIDCEDGIHTDHVSTVLLQYHNGRSWETIGECVTDGQQPTFDFGDAMRAQYFKKPGVYSYQILQTVGDTQGVVYDRNIHTFSVTVGDPDMTGLRITSVACHRNSDIVSGDVDGGFAVEVQFENRCATDETAVAVDVAVQMQNDSQSDVATKEGFRYGLFEKGSDTPMLLSPFTDRLGETRMIVHFDKAGVYTYDLRQIIPDVTEAGVCFDEAVYTLVITVSDSNGHLTATSRLTKDETAVEGVPVFYNRYELSPARLTLTGTKELVGRPLSDGEFTFLVKNGDEVVSVGRNRADGMIGFDAPLMFTTVGDYYYDVIEEGTVPPGVAADTAIYRLHIRVFDGGDGHLYTYHHVINSASDRILFRGEYTALPATLTLDGVVKLSGRDLVNEEFCFLLVETDGERMHEAANRTDGTFSFDPVVFDKAGEYEFTVQEVKSSVTHGITFDDAVYTVRVTVSDTANGALKTTYTLYRDETVCEALTFENAYAPTPFTTILRGVKTLEGRELHEGECSFVLSLADSKWKELSMLQTTQNRADGSFEFAPVTIAEGGVYRYIIKEKYSGETVDGVTHDEQYYRVLIIASDNHRGELEIDRTMIDNTNTFCMTMSFTNRYAIGDAVMAVVEGTVNMNGRPLETEECRFALYATDEQGNPVGDALAVVTNRADGSFCFEPMVIDTVGTHRFAVVQQNASLADVVIDETIHVVTIVTADNGVGGLSIVSQTVDGDAQQKLMFENTYIAPSVSTVTTTPSLPKAPQTGDASALWWMLMLALGGAAIVTLTSCPRHQTR